MRWVLATAGLAACGFNPTRAEVPPDAPVPVTTLFVADYAASFLHRYILDPDDEAPRPELTFSLNGALSPILLGNGDLIVSDLFTAGLTRFETPFVQPKPSGQIAGAGIATQVAKMLVMDGELFLANPAAGNLDRISLDEQGVPTMIDATPLGNVRGIAFDPVRRKLYVTQCCGTNALIVFDVHPDRTLTQVTTVGGLNNPHGIILTPWDELYVANMSANHVARFALDTQGMPVPRTPIAGNGLSNPADVVLTPWNELYITNLTGGTISRFAVDPITKIATPRDTFVVPQGNQVVYFAIDTRAR